MICEYFLAYVFKRQLLLCILFYKCFFFEKKKSFTSVLFKSNNNLIKTRCPLSKIMQCNFFPPNTLVISGSFDCSEMQVGDLRSGSMLGVSRFEWCVSNQELSVKVFWGHIMPGKGTRQVLNRNAKGKIQGEAKISEI